MSRSYQSNPNIALNDGTVRPQVGFGVFQIPNEKCSGAVETAFEVGYRSIDTASYYGNEKDVGRAINNAGIKRDDLYITTKLWVSDMDDPRAAIEKSLENLALDYVDLYLIHWPAPATGLYLQAWEKLEAIREEGLTRSIGVSNFLPEHLQEVVALGGTIPAVNQIELHPMMQNKKTVEANGRYEVATEAWSPLGRGAVLDQPAIISVAKAHNVSPSQVIIRWHLQQGRFVTPKSATASRILKNFDVFKFELSAEQLSLIDAQEQGLRTGPHPRDYHG